MTLICFTSQKGSPGATLTALAVAASFPVANGRRKILLEADCTGGTLALRYQLPTEPGLLTLAAAIRSSQDNELLWQHSQELPGGLSIVACPDGPDQVYAALAATGRSLGRWLEALPDVDVICDVGRLTPNSPTIDFVAEASAVLMVARPNVEQLQPAARRMVTLAPVIEHLGWVLIGDSPYGPADVESTYGMPVVGVISDDSRAAGKLESGVVSSKLVRSPLVRSAGSLAEVLADWLRPDGVAPNPPPQAEMQSVTPQPAPGHEAIHRLAEPAVPTNPPALWGEPDTHIERPHGHEVEFAQSSPPPPTDFGTPPMPAGPAHPVPFEPVNGQGEWVGSDEFVPPVSHYENEAVVQESEWSSHGGEPTQQFTGLERPDIAVEVGDRGSHAGPPLPPSSLSLAEAPSQPETSSPPQPAAELESAPQVASPDIHNGSRGPIAEFDDAEGWAVAPVPIAEEPAALQGTAEPIAEWILEPPTAPVPNGVEFQEPLPAQQLPPPQPPQPSGPVPLTGVPASPPVSTVIDQLDGKDRKDWTKLRNTKTWQRASTADQDSGSTNGFDQPPSLVNGAGQAVSSVKEVVLEEEEAAPNPFPHENPREGWTTG